jgi:hypothetical protein
MGISCSHFGRPGEPADWDEVSRPQTTAKDFQALSVQKASDRLVSFQVYGAMFLLQSRNNNREQKKVGYGEFATFAPGDYRIGM